MADSSDADWSISLSILSRPSSSIELVEKFCELSDKVLEALRVDVESGPELITAGMSSDRMFSDMTVGTMADMSDDRCVAGVMTVGTMTGPVCRGVDRSIRLMLSLTTNPLHLVTAPPCTGYLF